MFDSLVENDQYREEIEEHVWLMDDHRWALLAWETSAQRVSLARPCSLVHVDYHFDAVNDFQKRDLVEELRKGDLDTIRTLCEENQFVRKDSFIAPAVIRGLLSYVYFLCRQENCDAGFDDALSSAYQCRCESPKVRSSRDVIEHIAAFRPNDAPLIFDLCLDVFNNDGSESGEHADIWSDGEVREFLDAAERLIREATIVTVSLSFRYSGDVGQTRHLAELVVPKIRSIRS